MTSRRQLLAAVSTVQLASGVLGLPIAVKNRRPSNPYVVNLNLSSEHLARDQMVMGTARSAPGLMLVTQAVATIALWRQPSHRATKTLHVLGLVMTFGYLVERESPLLPAHADRLSTPLMAVGLGGAALMAWLGSPDAAA